MTVESAQLDFIQDADNMARGRGYARTAAERYGFPELAHRLRLDESTLRNQVEYRRRQDKRDSFWRPSQDCTLTLFFADRRLREELVALCDEEIAEVEVVSPEDALREIVAAARSKKYGEQAADEITRMYRRVKKGGPR